MFQKISSAELRENKITEEELVFNIQGLTCYTPPVGWIFNYLEDRWQYIGVYKCSSVKSQCFWQKDPRWKLYTDWKTEEDKKRQINPEYRHPKLSEFIRDCWTYRLGGYWYSNNGDPTYVTGTHWLYMSCYSYEGTPVKYREIDRDSFYAWRWAWENPLCYGLVEVTKRRSGKTGRVSCIAIDLTSMTPYFHAGIQSKTDKDAEQTVFKKAVVSPYRKFPYFFQPVSNLPKGGGVPASGLKFDSGKMGLDSEELESLIDFRSSQVSAYDGTKLGFYIADEPGKCHKKNTPILMYDGTIKMVQDVVNGDLVMGDDSTPRLVSGVTSGTEMMYDIIPNKGEPFGCNGSHILSLKSWMNYTKKRGVKRGGVLNISVNDLLKESEQFRRNTSLYRTGWELPEKELVIDPYFLGQWLGNGTQSCTGITIVNDDVKKYVEEIADTEGCVLINKTSDGITYNISRKKEYPNGGKNPIKEKLKSFNLLNNRHIPDVYMRSSRRQRLELLAGLLDTDGYLDKKPDGTPVGYEIVQKTKQLAKDILQLARSLGFGAMTKEKIATMKRPDGSIYKCLVYRTTMYGEAMFDLPMKVYYKKAIRNDKSGTGKNSLHSGYKIVESGHGDYYGFKVDGNHLYLLGDGTVTHNTTLCDVYERWNVVKYCLVDDEKKLIGKAYFVTTVEDMDNGGKEFLNLWQDSNQMQMDEGETVSGLVRIFTSSALTLNIDQYGRCNEQENTIKILKDRQKLISKPRELSSDIRKMPLTEKEAFQIDSSTCVFDPIRLNNRLNDLRFIDKRYKTGNLYWKDGVRFGEVVFVESANGNFLVMEEPPEGLRNGIRTVGDKYIPINTHYACGGIDSVDLRILEQKAIKTMSLCSITIIKKDDLLFKTDLDNNIICFYLDRPDTNVFYEDALKCLWWYGVLGLVETNKPGLLHYLTDCGCEGFVPFLPDSNKRGLVTSATTNNYIGELTAQFIDAHIDNVWYPRIIEDWLRWSPADTNAYDAAMSVGFALILLKAGFGKARQQKTQATKSASDYFSFVRKSILRKQNA